MLCGAQKFWIKVGSHFLDRQREGNVRLVTVPVKIKNQFFHEEKPSSSYAALHTCRAKRSQGTKSLRRQQYVWQHDEFYFRN